MFYVYCVIFLCLSLESSFSNGENKRTNVALNKPVFVKGKYAHCLTDGKFHTTVAPSKNRLPFVGVDLQNVYNLSSIHVFAQNEWSFNDAGLNIPFSVYIYKEFTGSCDFESYYPWTLIKSNLTFTKKGEEIIISGPITARYIVVLVDRESESTEANGLTMGELTAYGEIIEPGFRPEMFDSDPEGTNKHIELRRQLFEGQRSLHVRQAFFEYYQNPDYDDVALTWNHNKINSIAVEREKGRVIALSGNSGTARLFDDYFYNKILDNFKVWLSQNTSGAQYRRVVDNFNESDVLLINRRSKFDVEDIAQRILSGRNSALLTYEGTKQQVDDNLTQLIKKLNIGLRHHGESYVPTNHQIQQNIESAEFVPLMMRLETALKSWKYFKKIEFLNQYSENELRTPTVQNKIAQLLKRYLNFSKYISMCSQYPYKNNPKMKPALINTNKLFMIQRGDKIRPIPGYSRNPGVIYPHIKPATYSVTFNIDIWGNFFPMGGYAKAGESFSYRVIKATDPTLKEYRIRINPQTDYVGNKEQMARWPIATMLWDLKAEDQLISPFGGPIVLQIPSNSSITIEFKNVYRYPWFDNRNPDSEKNWEEEKKKYPGMPYLMVHGDNMISMLDAPTVMKMTAEEIKFATTYYDNMVKIMHNYRGTSHEATRLEVFVTDDEISAGFGHAGYPWMGYREWVNGFSDLNQIKQGRVIGYPHEVGHNLQVGQITFKNGGEVTNNMYIPVVHHYLLGLKSFDKGGVPGYRDMDIEQVVGVWKGGIYEGVRESYYTFFGRYFSPALVGNVIHTAISTKEPLNSEERKVGFFIRNLCNESGYDVVPFHRLWHFPINKETVEYCGRFSCWFPDDEITQLVPDLVEKAKATSKTKCSSDPPKKVAYKFDLMYGINKTKPQSIFFH